MDFIIGWWKKLIFMRKYMQKYSKAVHKIILCAKLVTADIYLFYLFSIIFLDIPLKKEEKVTWTGAVKVQRKY